MHQSALLSFSFRQDSKSILNNGIVMLECLLLDLGRKELKTYPILLARSERGTGRKDLQKTLCLLIVLAHQEIYPNELFLVLRQWFFRYGHQTRGSCATCECARNTNSQARFQACWVRHSRDEAQRRCSVMGPLGDFATHYILGSKITAMVTAAMKLKDDYSLEEKLWPT